MDPESSDGPRASGLVEMVVRWLMVAVAYWLCANGGRVVAHYGLVTAVWPPTGLALAFLLLGGLRLWPGVFLGEALAVGWELPPVPLPIHLPPAAVAAMGFGNTLEAVLGAWLLRRLAGFSGGFHTVREVVALLVIPLFAASLSASVGTLTLVAIGALSWAEMPENWWTWWVGNTLGVLTVTPFLCALFSGRARRPRRREVVEALVFLLLAGLTVAYAMFGAFPDAPRVTREAWLLYPFLVWAALRFGPAGASAAIFGVSALALLSTAWRLGSFEQPVLAEAVLHLQVFVGVVAASILLLAASVEEQRKAYAALSRARDALEDKVVERTTELQTANVLLAARNTELAAANAELDGFASRVSHDLRAPVRAVSGFAEVLLESHRDALDEETLALLHRIARAAGRMNRLIDRLLEMARLGRRALEVVDVDVNALVLGIAEDQQIPSSVDLRIGPLPPCRADPALLEAVFANLLENAVKYTRAVARPLIEVSGERGSDGVTYRVRDNGAGFDMKYAGQLFRVFARLHGSEFEGSGVGLAIVRRIVDLHGGRVWAEGEVGAGATFWFHIPDRPPVGEAPTKAFSAR